MIAEKIKEHRLSLDMTQEDLASLICVSRAVISMWECEVRLPNINYMVRLCKVFKITPNEFLGMD